MRIYGQTILFLLFSFISFEIFAFNTASVAKNATYNSVVTDSDSTTVKKKERTTKNVSKTTESFTSYSPMHSSLRKGVAEHIRHEKGNAVSTYSYVINDGLQPSTWSNLVSFTINDQKQNIHSFSGTQAFMYGLNFTSENNVNTRRDLIGFEYRFKKPDTLKLSYSARARIEQDNESQTYYQLGIGAKLNLKKSTNAASVEYFPVRNGPGHILEIYRLQFTNFNTFQLTERLKQIALIEGNYYTDEQGDFIVSARTEYLLTKSALFRVAPLIEGAYGVGSIDRRDNYPYWLARQRVYGGGGLSLGIGSENSAFQLVADASIFTELNQAGFERYTGTLSYRIKNFSTINAGFEVNTIEDFYSNVFQLGMVYHFR